MGKTKEELQVRNREIQDRMAELNDKAFAEKREFNPEEKAEWEKLTREAQVNDRELKNLLTDAELAQVREKEDKNAQLREMFKNRDQKREITLWPTSVGSTSNITASGAINLSIHDLIPTLHEGLDLPSTLRVATGVTGKLIADATGLDVVRFLAGAQGGDQQISARVACNEIDLLLFFRDPISAKPNEVNEANLLRLCDVHNIPVATNIATAEALIHALERGDLDWRDIVNPKK